MYVLRYTNIKFNIKSTCTLTIYVLQNVYLFLAENRVRGVQLFELHASLAELGRRRTASGEMGPDALTSLLLQSKNILEESLELLKHEPEELPEGKIAMQAEKNLNGLEILLQSITTSSGICPI